MTKPILKAPISSYFYIGLILLVLTPIACSQKSSQHENQLDSFSQSKEATQLARQGQFKEAEASAKSAFAVAESNHSFPGKILALISLGEVYKLQKKDSDVAEVYLQAQSLVDEMLIAECRYTVEILESLQSLASMHSYHGRHNEAEKLLLHVISAIEQSSDLSDTNLYIPLLTLANLYRVTNKFAESESTLKRALEIMEQTSDIQGYTLADLWISWANLEFSKKNYVEALGFLLRARDNTDQNPGLLEVSSALLENIHGQILAAQGKISEATPYFERAVSLLEKLYGINNPEVATRIHNLANNYYLNMRFKDAEREFLRAVSASEMAHGPESIEVSYSLRMLGETQMALEDYAAAASNHLRSLVIAEKVYGPNHPNLIGWLNRLEVAYHRMGESDKADVYQQRAKLLLEKENSGPVPPSNVER